MARGDDAPRGTAVRRGSPRRIQRRRRSSCAVSVGCVRMPRCLLAPRAAQTRSGRPAGHHRGAVATVRARWASAARSCLRRTLMATVASHLRSPSSGNCRPTCLRPCAPALRPRISTGCRSRRAVRPLTRWSAVNRRCRRRRPRHPRCHRWARRIRARSPRGLGTRNAPGTAPATLTTMRRTLPSSLVRRHLCSEEARHTAAVGAAVASEVRAARVLAAKEARGRQRPATDQ